MFVKLVIAGGPSMQINGVAHTFITAGNFATARAFDGQLTVSGPYDRGRHSEHLPLCQRPYGIPHSCAGRGVCWPTIPLELCRITSPLFSCARTYDGGSLAEILVRLSATRAACARTPTATVCARRTFGVSRSKCKRGREPACAFGANSNK